MTVEPEANIARSASAPFRVLVVDDSAIIRGLLCRILESDPDIEVTRTVSNGHMAIGALEKDAVDVVVLDIEMPVMDGLTALPRLIEVDPKVQVIMASTLTHRNAEISLKALSLGAADYIPKPQSTSGITSGYDFKRDLVNKVKALGAARRAAGGTAAARSSVAPAHLDHRAGTLSKLGTDTPIKLRAASPAAPYVLAIGSSTGGPPALFELLPELGKDFALPILITQHMPATFTMILADHIGRATGRSCAEGVNGEPVVAGRIYVAPGDYHMMVEATDKGNVICLSQSPPENFCRPSVDPMLRSMARVYGSHVLAVMLTGMGQDGLEGGKAIVEAGGNVVAQDEATSVVWGMPGAVATAGLCSAVLPKQQIGSYICGRTIRPAA